MPALARTAISALASACATDARPPKAFAVASGRLVGTVRLWHVSAGGKPALMLGPLAVDSTCRGLGVGAALTDRAIEIAGARGHGAVILLGDAPYYARFGFSPEKMGEVALPGPFERDRLLGLELSEGALDGARGMITATGALLLKRKARAKALRAVPQAA
jgi:predicted N-acetyltransferase YhbS